MDFSHTVSDGNPMTYYPKLINNFCGADSVNSFVIDAEGDIYKCWSDIGVKEHSIDNINNTKRYSDLHGLTTL